MGSTTKSLEFNRSELYLDPSPPVVLECDETSRGLRDTNGKRNDTVRRGLRCPSVPFEDGNVSGETVTGLWCGGRAGISRREEMEG